MKKIWLYILIGLWSLLQVGLPLGVFASNLPSFNSFADKLQKWSERVYDPARLGVDSNKTLQENIANIFYPSDSGGGRIRSVLQTLFAGLFVGMIMFTGLQFIRFADDGKKMENLKNNLLYIAYGGFLIFGSAYVVSLLRFESNDGSASLIQNLQDKLLVNIIVFMKSLAFFFAIVMIVRNGLQMIRAMDAEDKRKKGIAGVINVLSALVFIKLLDFVYYIAQQTDFKSRVVDLFVSISKIVGYVLGWLMVLYLIYAGYLLVTSGGEDDAYKKAVNTLKSIFMVAIVIFLFLMIIYQLVKDLS